LPLAAAKLAKARALRIVKTTIKLDFFVIFFSWKVVIHVNVFAYVGPHEPRAARVKNNSLFMSGKSDLATAGLGRNPLSSAIVLHRRPVVKSKNELREGNTG